MIESTSRSTTSSSFRVHQSEIHAQQFSAQCEGPVRPRESGLGKRINSWNGNSRRFHWRSIGPLISDAPACRLRLTSKFERQRRAQSTWSLVNSILLLPPPSRSRGQYATDILISLWQRSAELPNPAWDIRVIVQVTLIPRSCRHFYASSVLSPSLYILLTTEQGTVNINIIIANHKSPEC